MSEIISWVTTNWVKIVEVYLAVIGLASVIVKLTPTLRDDTILQSIVSFIGKWIALNRNSADDDAARATSLKK